MGDFKVRESIICPKCNHEVFYYPDELSEDKIFCGNCGESISLDKKEYINCTGCGEKIEFDRDEIDGNYVFCQNCGTKNLIKPINTSSENKVLQTTQAAVRLLEEKTEKTSSPFAETADDKELDDEEVMKTIHSCSYNWRSSIQDSSDRKSVFTDNFAHGMPEWDLLPPDIAVRRKVLRRSSGQGR